MPKVGVEGVARAIKEVIPKKITGGDVVFFCVGTDRSTGDSLGPLVGTSLARLGYNVMGTLNEPVHAMNLNEKLDVLKSGSGKLRTIVAVDACLGQLTSVGSLTVDKGPVSPGAGVNKELPKVGDYHITGIVNVGGFMEYFVLQNTRLSLVMELADAIVRGIQEALPLCYIAEVAAASEVLDAQR